MSDIIYTPPAPIVPPSTTINPTNLRIPVRSNATTFIDSCIYNSANIIQFKNSLGNNSGIDFDLINFTYNIGNFTNNQTKITINDNTGLINTSRNGLNKGIYLDCNSNLFYFGNYSNNTYLEYTNSNTRTVNANNDGYSLNFSSRKYFFGNYGGSSIYSELDVPLKRFRFFNGSENDGIFLDLNNKTYVFGNIATGGSNTRERIVVDGTGRSIFTQDSFGTFGFIFDFANRRFRYGAINGTNQINMFIDETNQIVRFDRQGTFKCVFNYENATQTMLIGARLNYGNSVSMGTNDSSQAFIFNGVGITTATATGTASHLKVLVNGTAYRIQLLNP